MALTSWSGEIVLKNDIYIAKNYLLEDELSILNRLVTAFLEIAELRVSLKKTLTLDFWKNSIDKLLKRYPSGDIFFYYLQKIRIFSDIIID